MPEVIMPKMGDAMEEGTLVKWLKSEGDEVSEGDAIAEIETDKVTLELEAEDAGTLAQTYSRRGPGYPRGRGYSLYRRRGRGGPGAVRRRRSRGRGRSRRGATAAPRPRRPPRPRIEAPEEDETQEAPSAAGDGAAAGGNGHFRASPIVRRLAQENDLDLAKIDGSGPAGRIVERDVRAAMERGDAQTDGQAGGQADVAAPEEPQPQQAEMQGFQPARLPEPPTSPEPSSSSRRG